MIRKHIHIFWALLLLSIPSVAQPDFTASNLPIVVIETDSQEIVDEYRIVANMGIIHNSPRTINHTSDPYNNYSGYISIEIRGSTSQAYPKKSYGFETQDVWGENRNVSLLDLPEENDWVLYAPYSDKTLIRNILSYKLSRELGHYAPRTKLCELVLNGEYRGVYVLIEKIKRDRNRVDISTLNPDETAGDDLTGGYIIKIDKQTGDSGPLWTSAAGGIYFQYEYPDYDEIVPEQKEYIRGCIDDFEEALNADYFADPEFGYRKYMNVHSLVDLFLVNELTKNVDGYILSTFIHKDKESEGGKLTMGPVWDFNLAFGNANTRNAFLTSGFQLDENPVPWWWDRLMEDSTFTGQITARWDEVRQEQFDNASILSAIDSLRFLLADAQERNFVKWDILGRKVWPNYYAGETYNDEIDYLKNWTLDRLHWLDTRISSRTSVENIYARVYPNPFSNYFHYDFALNKPGNISLVLYDMNGRAIHYLINNMDYQAGEHVIEWQATDLASSFYILVLSLDGEIVSKKKLLKM